MTGTQCLCLQLYTELYPLKSFHFNITYFPAYSAHPKLFCIPFEVQITRT
jgi:hypothetical protein